MVKNSMTMNSLIMSIKDYYILYVFVFTSARYGSCSGDQSFRVIYIIYPLFKHKEIFLFEFLPILLLINIHWFSYM